MQMSYNVIQRHTTTASLANNTNNMFVTNSTEIRVGDMVEGFNVSNNGQQHQVIQEALE